MTNSLTATAARLDRQPPRGARQDQPTEANADGLPPSRRRRRRRFAPPPRRNARVFNYGGRRLPCWPRRFDACNRDRGVIATLAGGPRSPASGDAAHISLLAPQPAFFSPRSRFARPRVACPLLRCLLRCAPCRRNSRTRRSGDRAIAHHGSKVSTAHCLSGVAARVASERRGRADERDAPVDDDNKCIGAGLSPLAGNAVLKTDGV